MSSLQFSQRTAVSDDEIDSFLQNVEAVSDALKDIKNGTFDPETCSISGYKSPNQQRAEENEQRRLEKERNARIAERFQKLKVEEHETWWKHARAHHDISVPDKNTCEAKNTEDEFINAAVKAYVAKDANDYSIWETWSPDDPATLQEIREAEEARQKRENDKFERANADFCSNFKQDLEKRKRSQRERDKDVQKSKSVGNALFKEKKYVEAIEQYMKALKRSPLCLHLLCNISLSYFRMGDLTNCIEFSNRALFVNPCCVKALVRQSEASHAKKEYKLAAEYMKKAMCAAGSNRTELQERHSVLVGDYEDNDLHQRLLNKYDLQAQKVDKANVLQHLKKLLEAVLPDPTSLEVNPAKDSYHCIAQMLKKHQDARNFMRTSGSLEKLCDQISARINQYNDEKVASNEDELLALLEVAEACIGRTPENQIRSYRNVKFRESIVRLACANQSTQLLLFLNSAMETPAWAKHIVSSEAIPSLFQCMTSASKQCNKIAIEIAFSLSCTDSGVAAIWSLDPMLVKLVLEFLINLLPANITNKGSNIVCIDANIVLGLTLNMSTARQYQRFMDANDHVCHALVLRLSSGLSAMQSLLPLNPNCLSRYMENHSNTIENTLAVLLNTTYAVRSQSRDHFVSNAGVFILAKWIQRYSELEAGAISIYSKSIYYAVSLFCRHRHLQADKTDRDLEVVEGCMDTVIDDIFHLLTKIHLVFRNNETKISYEIELCAQLWCHLAWIAKHQIGLYDQFYMNNLELAPTAISTLQLFSEVQQLSPLYCKNAASERVLGNTLSLLITTLSHGELCRSIISLLKKNVELFVSLLQYLSNGPARTNVAILLAKMCQQDADMKSQLRSMRALEMMIQINQSAGFTAK